MSKTDRNLPHRVLTIQQNASIDHTCELQFPGHGPCALEPIKKSYAWAINDQGYRCQFNTVIDNTGQRQYTHSFDTRKETKLQKLRRKSMRRNNKMDIKKNHDT